MSNLRDQFRRALDERAPNAKEAREDKERLFRALDRPEPSKLWRVALSAFAFAVAASAAVFFLGRPRVEPVGQRPLAPLGAGEAGSANARSSIEIYVHRSSDPEANALSVTLDQPGEHP